MQGPAHVTQPAHKQRSGPAARWQADLGLGGMDLELEVDLYVVSVSLSVSVCETQPNALRTLPMQCVFFRGSYADTVHD